MGGWAVRLPITALATALLVSIVPSVTSAQTAFGILNVWLKKHESADAPNDQQITLYQKSKALVIGMDHYSSGWPSLSNGVKDAEEVATGLSAQGFEVTFKKDLKSRDLDDALRNFFIVDGDDPNARLLLWFAGHGDTIDGEAYLVPTDAPLPKVDAEFRVKAISLRRFGEYMREAKARHVLAIFDSCFSGGVFNLARSAPPPAITLATTQPVREFISSGEAEQQVSDDGTFRKLFLDVLAGKEPDADANHDGYVTGTELGLFLQQKMTNLTDNRQTPRYGKLNAYGYDRGDFVFQIGKPNVSTSAAVPAPQPTSDVAQAWAAAQGTTSQAVLEDFIRRYGDSFYSTLARARLEELKKQAREAEAAARAKEAAEAKAAEAARIKAEQEAKAAEAKAAEAARIKAEQEAKAAEAKAAEAARIKAEQEAKAAEAKTAEAAQRPQNLAALAPPEQPTKPAPLSPDEIVRQLQIELRRVGCFTFNIDGQWNANSEHAAELFNKHSGMSLDIKAASLDALDAVRGKAGRVCPLVCGRGYRVEGDRCVQITCEAGFVLDSSGDCQKRKQRPQTVQGPTVAPKAGGKCFTFNGKQFCE
jgi:hypothetical protein